MSTGNRILYRIKKGLGNAIIEKTGVVAAVFPVFVIFFQLTVPVNIFFKPNFINQEIKAQTRSYYIGVGKEDYIKKYCEVLVN